MENKVDLVDLCRRLVKKIEDLPETKKYTGDYKHAYQFEGEGVDPFYLQVDHGKLAVHKGVLKGDLDVKSTLRADSSTLRDLLVGKLKPLDAAEQGKWGMQSRNYSGNLLILLFRIGHDKIVEEILAGL